MNERDIVYKITPRVDWEAAVAAGHYAGAPIDLADGFIHFSTAAQADETARKHFHGQHDLLLVAVRTSGYGNAMRWEVSRGGALFPHLYGAFDMESVVWTLPIETDTAGVPHLTFAQADT
ncbi:MAG: DUF952 domain-containing protein [Pseudomonadota bacterium]